MKIKKSQLKELIKHSLYELSGAEKAKKMGLKSVGFGNWEDPKTGQHYSTRDGKLHKVDSTDKDDVGGPAHPNVPKKKPSKSKVSKIDTNPFDIEDPVQKDPADDPKYTGDDPFDIEDPLTVGDDNRAPDGKSFNAATAASTPTPKQINILNKKAEKGDGELIDTEYNGMVTWTNGDPNEDSFIATDEDGEEIEDNEKSA